MSTGQQVDFDRAAYSINLLPRQTLVEQPSAAYRKGVFKMGWLSHCEEAADEAIPAVQHEIASPAAGSQ